MTVRFLRLTSPGDLGTERKCWAQNRCHSRCEGLVRERVSSREWQWCSQSCHGFQSHCHSSCKERVGGVRNRQTTGLHAPCSSLVGRQSDHTRRDLLQSLVCSEKSRKWPFMMEIARISRYFSAFYCSYIQRITERNKGKNPHLLIFRVNMHFKPAIY